jgi:hypothetical protein
MHTLLIAALSLTKLVSLDVTLDAADAETIMRVVGQERSCCSIYSKIKLPSGSLAS